MRPGTCPIASHIPTSTASCCMSSVFNKAVRWCNVRSGRMEIKYHVCGFYLRCRRFSRRLQERSGEGDTVPSSFFSFFSGVAITIDLVRYGFVDVDFTRLLCQLYCVRRTILRIEMTRTCSFARSCKRNCRSSGLYRADLLRTPYALITPAVNTVPAACLK